MLTIDDLNTVFSDHGFLRGLHRALHMEHSVMTLTDTEAAWLRTQLREVYTARRWEVAQMIPYDFGRIAGERLAEARGDRESQPFEEFSIYIRDRINTGDLAYLCPRCGQDLDYQTTTSTWTCSATCTTEGMTL